MPGNLSLMDGDNFGDSTSEDELQALRDVEVFGVVVAAVLRAPGFAMWPVLWHMMGVEIARSGSLMASDSHAGCNGAGRGLDEAPGDTAFTDSTASVGDQCSSEAFGIFAHAGVERCPEPVRRQPCSRRCFRQEGAGANPP